MKIENSTDLIEFLKKNLRLTHFYDEDGYDLKLILKCVDPESKKDIILAETWIPIDELVELRNN